MRSLAFVFLILAAPALAQGSKAPAQKRPPASVLDSKEDDEAPAAAALPPELVFDADRALAAGLTAVFEPAPDEIRVFAIEDLALMQDPRAVDPLASLALDGNPAIALAAVKAVALFNTPRATQVLENVVRHPRLAMNLKEQALKSLPFHRRVRAREFLAMVSKSSAYPQTLQRAASEALVSFDLSQPSLPASAGANR